MTNNRSTDASSSGIAGLDDILRGGFPRNCLYLISGTPGTGKTTLAMQFLLAGLARGEKCMYVSLSETRAEMSQVAQSHGWELDALEILELVPSEGSLSPDTQLTVFNPSEFELAETTQALIAAVEEHQPRRLVIDSLSELRLIAQNALRYRRQILALKQFFSGRDCTVLMLDDRTGGVEDDHLQSIAHGVLVLEQLANQYGAERRRLRMVKLRGVAYRGGFHDFVVRKGGLDVFPRLVAAEHQLEFRDQEFSSGNAQLDGLLGGGLPAGTSTLMLGPAGTGKSTIATQFAVAAAARGERSCLFIFDESAATFRARSRKLGLGVEQALGDGLMSTKQIDPAELSPGEFAAIVRRSTERPDASGKFAKVVVIDSLNGYLNAMPEERFLSAQLHELLSFLGQRGVLTIMTVTQAGMVGNMGSPIDTTYLADNVILFRYFEAAGWVRRAISVVKKRTGYHERTIRELDLGAGGIKIGEPLEEFHGILTGVPSYSGKDASLMRNP